MTVEKIRWCDNSQNKQLNKKNYLNNCLDIFKINITY